ncbi:twin-arginine translocase TatA/TatE family subunit [Myxococcus qinghaiensis]|uniref:twin-arginine translocase TatA/TatE family subunit n=2 Tax=Myxococcus TaxID=32 RepID=UPI0020A7B81F|nr:twin-arginine translocase TatA/TatE family subunit [Myxococcus qinghaiensis]MCP3164617.1 twin-arginine translocase TatA/TatE family subunit [Myxococcus qinghaiensis]
MFNIGAGEMVLIAVAALLILGPQRLPELARAIGKFMREFRRQTDEVRNVVEREFYTMDHELNRDPTPPVRPGTAFAHSPAPQALPPDASYALPPAAVSDSTEPTPEAQHPRAPLGLDAPEVEPDAVASAPSELAEPAVPADPTEPGAPAETPSSTSSSAAAEGVGADGLPRLAPLPGTVARNAPKRS